MDYRSGGRCCLFSLNPILLLQIFFFLAHNSEKLQSSYNHLKIYHRIAQLAYSHHATKSVHSRVTPPNLPPSQSHSWLRESNSAYSDCFSFCRSALIKNHPLWFLDSYKFPSQRLPPANKTARGRESVHVFALRQRF